MSKKSRIYFWLFNLPAVVSNSLPNQSQASSIRNSLGHIFSVLSSKYCDAPMTFILCILHKIYLNTASILIPCDSFFSKIFHYDDNNGDEQLLSRHSIPNVK